MATKEDIDAYRRQVYEALVQLRGGDTLDEAGRKVLKDILASFTDHELEFGMPFNTAEEMARMLLEG